ncbi:enoyl-CoA hydratase/isomerase family protein [Streptomyces boninensis]|uniref:enoyl-CoA hydratase/isomerase family protein n=1 Tax=Streptomyces boninensis TaxID=2039455 RepID=UPI003B2185FA
MSGHIRCETEGPVAVVTLDRPAKLNALTPEMADELRRLLAGLDDDTAVRAVVLTGAGDRAFCAGSDIPELDTYDTPWAFRNRLDYGDVLRALRTPVIAAVGGHALGGGLELALACDIRLAAESARFAAPEIKLGWIGGSGMAAQLAHSIGASNAALMLLTGDPVDARQALAWGLVSQVLPDDGLLPAARELAARIAARAPIAAQTAKANLRAAHSMPLQQAIQYERDLQTVCFATADAAEGRAAFKEKRAPRFSGR